MKANQLIKRLSKKPKAVNNLPLDLAQRLLKCMSAGASNFNGEYPLQFFDFGAVSENSLIEEFNSAFEAYIEGFLRLPAPFCIFERHTLPDMRQHMHGNFVYLYTTPEAFSLLTADMQFPVDAEEFVDPTGDDRSIIGTAFVNPLNSKTDWACPGLFSSLAFEKSKRENARAYQVLAMSKDKPLDHTGTRGWEKNGELWADQIFTPLFAFLARLHAKGVRREVVPPPEGLNKSRAKRGIAPSVSYTKVSIDPYHQTLGHSGPRDCEEYTPKRYHFRRGHVRRFENGQKTWVRPCFVGSLTSGEVKHTYEVSR